MAASINSSDIRLYYESCYSEEHLSFMTEGNI